ncbi:hypothetical protein D3C87_1911480 [compost metagenome]
MPVSGDFHYFPLIQSSGLELIFKFDWGAPANYCRRHDTRQICQMGFGTIFATQGDETFYHPEWRPDARNNLVPTCDGNNAATGSSTSCETYYRGVVRSWRIFLRGGGIAAVLF